MSEKSGMVRAVFPNARLARDIFDLLNTVSDEGVITFQVDASGLLLKQIDPTKVCLCEFLWKSSSFSAFTPTQPGLVSFDIDVALKWLKNVAETDTLEFSVQGTEVVFKRTGAGVRELTLPKSSKDHIAPEMDIPPLSVRFSVNLQSFGSWIDEVSFLSDTIAVSADKETLSMATQGKGKTQHKFTWKTTAGLELRSESAKAENRFLTAYLTAMITKVKALVPEAEISLGDNLPLILKAHNEKFFELQYVVSPRSA